MHGTSTNERQRDAIVSIEHWMRRQALHMLTRAFADDPPCRWLYPDAAAYRRFFPEFATAFGAAAIDLGTPVRPATCPASPR
jgi:hypothetical protein